MAPSVLHMQLDGLLSLHDMQTNRRNGNKEKHRDFWAFLTDLKGGDKSYDPKGPLSSCNNTGMFHYKSTSIHIHSRDCSPGQDKVRINEAKKGPPYPYMYLHPTSGQRVPNGSYLQPERRGYWASF